MATTAIWDVKDNLKRVLDYCANPNKTTNIDFSEYAYQGLNNVLEYTAQDIKTEKQMYVSCLNCEPETSCSEMISTKIRFQKEDGILAFHAYQSFAPNEVSAETAHQIGIEFAQAMWGDRFEVQISTHIDKEHFHNHFVSAPIRGRVNPLSKRQA
ncbi:relaxase/mobilization nuclease domain-containing protein [[Clostridium] innocuum]|uniref:relaxase/mobilization nuclease domain-containing protein n=1 Tax=Clostridium innocuum TaxID=1522 RepID=UPI001EDF5E01|nr:relaxase/mobilization nuclease domain-containing protein [[Clostridium] innocuum]MCG4662399.1 relaxase/mobilization nuclease domain-containing protein [[Clostridium] innocuum]